MREGASLLQRATAYALVAGAVCAACAVSLLFAASASAGDGGLASRTAEEGGAGRCAAPLRIV